MATLGDQRPGTDSFAVRQCLRATRRRRSRPLHLCHREIPDLVPGQQSAVDGAVPVPRRQYTGRGQRAAGLHVYPAAGTGRLR
ncbi:hypothetical protein D3C76_1612050 [compost metagenome]